MGRDYTGLILRMGHILGLSPCLAMAKSPNSFSIQELIGGCKEIARCGTCHDHLQRWGRAWQRTQNLVGDEGRVQKKHKALNETQKQSRLQIRLHTATLISVANKAEPLSQRIAEPESTSDEERIATQELITAQDELLKVIDQACEHGLTLEYIVAEAIHPVVDSWVVSELAAFAIDHVIVCAKGSTRQKSPS